MSTGRRLQIPSLNRRISVRTTIVIDDQLMAEALRLSGARTKKQAVEEGLRLLIRAKLQEKGAAASRKCSVDRRSRCDAAGLTGSNDVGWLRH